MGEYFFGKGGGHIAKISIVLTAKVIFSNIEFVLITCKTPIFYMKKH